MVFARACAVIGLVGAVLSVVGSLGAWATVGSTSVTGVDRGADGWITLVLAVLAAGFLAGIFAPKPVARVLRWFPLPFAALILLVALLNIGDIASTSTEFSNQVSSDTFTLSIGWGLWLVLAGAIAMGVSSVFLMFAPMPVPAHQAPPVPTAYVPGGFTAPGWHPQQPYPGQHPAQPYPPQPYPGQYPAQPHPPQPYPGQYPVQPYPPRHYPVQHPPQGEPPPAPAPPAWPTTGPAYPGSTDADGGSSD